MTPAPYSNLPTPDQIGYQRKLGGQMLQQGMDASPVGHWTQALARVLQGGVGGYRMNQADGLERERNQGLVQALRGSSAFKGLGDGDLAIMGADPDLMRATAAKVYGNKLDPHAGLRNQLMQGQLEQQRQELAFKREMHPQQMAMSQAELELKRKALESQRFIPIDDTKQLFNTSTGQFVQSPGGLGGLGAKKFGEKTGEAQAERYADIVKHGDKQPQMAFDLARLEELSNAIGNPNLYNRFLINHGGFFKSLGIEPGKMRDIEAFQSLISRMAPNMRPPGAGATSDFDLQQYINSLPGLLQTKDGRTAVIAHQRALSQHSVAQQRIAQQVMLGKLSREQGEQLIANLPDPHDIWRKTQQQAGRSISGGGQIGGGQGGYPYTATNPSTGQRIRSRDGVNWEPAQ